MSCIEAFVDDVYEWVQLGWDKVEYVPGISLSRTKDFFLEQRFSYVQARIGSFSEQIVSVKGDAIIRAEHVSVGFQPGKCAFREAHRKIILGAVEGPGSWIVDFRGSGPIPRGL